MKPINQQATLDIIAIIGNLLNFPRRDHLLAASYKSSQPKDPWK